VVELEGGTDEVSKIQVPALLRHPDRNQMSRDMYPLWASEKAGQEGTERKPVWIRWALPRLTFSPGPWWNENLSAARDRRGPVH